MYNNTEFVIWSWSSILTAGCGHDAWDCKFPSAAIPHSRMRDRAVRDDVMSSMTTFLAWTCTILQTGKFPNVGFQRECFENNTCRARFANLDLADGYSGAFVGVKADRKACERHLHTIMSSIFGCLGEAVSWGGLPTEAPEHPASLIWWGRRSPRRLGCSKSTV